METHVNKGRGHGYIKKDIAGKLTLIEAWYRDGLIDIDVAKILGISIRTFYSWKKLFPEFAEATKRGKEITDIVVENSLYRRAIGFDYEETTEELKKGVNGEPEYKVTKRVTKHMPGDVSAQISWLTNRKPEVWKNRNDKNVTGKISILEFLEDDND